MAWWITLYPEAFALRAPLLAGIEAGEETDRSPSSAALGGSERYVGEEFPVLLCLGHSDPSPRPSQGSVAPELPREA